ncbi:hypothetical protein SAMN05421504_104230 [Amycolatopsis xylanica]|uniref:Uncharacterized protein n=1 Tax=Amycolatopsis xylanica TaxID=589385 RepID=A0A1H3GEM9_9PSEU|nr:hypothetical protein [Amycolatopsis xylanica]SDY01731.1 hypothetical protein SAMN05421504_104230 [Amycolatopsis xylanica]
MNLDISYLQEFEAQETPALEGCPVLGTCCGPVATTVPWLCGPPTTIFTCFGGTFAA